MDLHAIEELTPWPRFASRARDDSNFIVEGQVLAELSQEARGCLEARMVVLVEYEKSSHDALDRRNTIAAP